jgi:hypothetical protein
MAAFWSLLTCGIACNQQILRASTFAAGVAPWEVVLRVGFLSKSPAKKVKKSWCASAGKAHEPS